MKGKLICVIMAIVMTLLCACGSDAAPAGEQTPREEGRFSHAKSLFDTEE